MRSRKFLKAEQARLAWDVPGLVAGVDEAGRGPLAGPVVAAAVILDDGRRIRGLADSKVLTPLKRERLFDEIRDKALAFCIAEASVEEIDTLNILQATMLAMKRAVEGLRLPPNKVLVDGNRLPHLRVRAEAIVGGDAKPGDARRRVGRQQMRDGREAHRDDEHADDGRADPDRAFLVVDLRCDAPILGRGVANHWCQAPHGRTGPRDVLLATGVP